MKLGDVLKKERENKGLAAATMAEKLGIPLDAYEQIERGGSEEFEQAARLVVNFAKALDYPGVNGLYYPCGIPFQELDDYAYRVVR